MQINFKEDGVYRVRDGKLEKITTPLSGYGEQSIIWSDGKITNYKVTFAKK